MPLGPSLPALIPTVFGYVVIGKSFNPLSALQSEPLRPPNPIPSPVLLGCNVQNQVKDFWRMEEANLLLIRKPKEKFAERFFQRTKVQLPNKKHKARLPFHPDASILGESRFLALERFHQLEAKFQKNSKLKETYVEFMPYYLENGYME